MVIAIEMTDAREVWDEEKGSGNYAETAWAICWRVERDETSGERKQGKKYDMDWDQ